MLKTIKEFITAINESFASQNLARFNDWVQKNVKDKYSKENYLARLFYNRNSYLKSHQLTDENTFFCTDKEEANRIVKDLYSQKEEVGVIWAIIDFKVDVYLGYDFVEQPDSNTDQVFLIFFKTEDVETHDPSKPKASNKYKWHGNYSQMLGSHRESEFRDRKRYNDWSDEKRKDMDAYTKRTTAWDSIPDQNDGLYPKDRR